MQRLVTRSPRCGVFRQGFAPGVQRAKPELISEISNTLGSQSVVLSVEAKKIKDNKWEVYIENGRESSGVDVMEWIKRGEIYGAGEILLTSIDRDGTGRGFDLDNP